MSTSSPWKERKIPKVATKEGILKARGKRYLKGMLDWGEKERQRVLEMLKVAPPEMKEEYDMLLDRLHKLETTLKQIALRLE